VEVHFKIFTVASIAFANTTAIISIVAAIVGPPSSLLAAITIVVKTEVCYQCFFSFCFGNDNGDSNGTGDANNNGNSNSDDLSLFVL
jgi:hypothetical protein